MNKILTFLFIGLLNFTNHAFSDEKILSSLNEGNKLIFIRHAIAPGSGDPDNFNLNDCSTQRNLSKEGKRQAEYIGEFFRNNKYELSGEGKILSGQPPAIATICHTTTIPT